MALSDQLMQLSTRSKELEDRAAAAKTKAKADLEQDVKAARESAQAQGDALREGVKSSKGKISSWWHDVQRSWDDHLAAVRNDVGHQRAQHDLKKAQQAAAQADDDAAFAVDFANAAVEEAEYAVLDAALARMEADELATT